MTRKPTIEQCQRIHIRDVKEAIPHNALEVTIEVGTQEVRVVGKLTNLKNGYRYFFICGGCDKLYESMYCSDFSLYVCRNCLGCVYASTRKYGVKLGQYEHP